MEKGQEKQVPEEELPPYVGIEQEVLSQKNIGRSKWVKPLLFISLCAVTLGGLILAFRDSAVALAAAGQAEKNALRVKVKDDAGFREESYSELVGSESDSIDFFSPFRIDGLTLEGNTLTVDSPNGDLDMFVLYQPGGSVFWDPTKSFVGDVSCDLSAMGLEDGADYLLCYGNAYSEKLRAVWYPGGPTVEGSDWSVVIDESLAMRVVVRSQAE